MLVNITNHNSEQWSEEQLSAAHEAYGDIVDIPFPHIPADDPADAVLASALGYAERIASLSPSAVLCEGEFCFTFALVCALLKKGIPVVAATSERLTTETVLPDGSTKKSSIFNFIAFREYRFADQMEENE